MPNFRKLFSVKQAIGAGSFGQVRIVVDRTTEQLYAAKFEKKELATLEKEVEVYRVLSSGDGSQHVPRVHFFGNKDKENNVLVLDLMGPSLERIFRICDRSLSLPSVSMLGSQLLSHLQHIHENGYLHRDIKPANIVMGRGDSEHRAYFVDFGLAKKLVRVEERSKQTARRGFVGTRLFASIDADAGNEQSERSDLEAFGYVLVYLLNGSLPWESYEVVAEAQSIKANIKIEELCNGKATRLAPYFVEVFNTFDKPDYKKLQQILESMCRARKEEDENFEYEWLEMEKYKEFQKDYHVGSTVSLHQTTHTHTHTHTHTPAPSSSSSSSSAAPPVPAVAAAPAPPPVQTQVLANKRSRHQTEGPSKQPKKAKLHTL